MLSNFKDVRDVNLDGDSGMTRDFRRMGAMAWRVTDGYESYIENLASSEAEEIFYNSCESHALIVLKNLVKNAKHLIL